MRNRLEPLRSRAFRRLAVAFLVNELGDWFASVALALLVFDATGSAIATAGIFLATQFAPALFAPPLVARLELAKSGRALPWVYGAEAAVFALLALTASDLVLAAVFVLAAVDGSLASAARALARAHAAQILAPGDLLREGNALLNLAFAAGAAIGPALAGVAVALSGPPTALAGAGLAFLAVAILVVAVPRLPRVAELVSWRSHLREGIDYVRERATLARLVALEAAAIACFTVIVPVEVVFAKDTLDAGDAGYGVLIGAWGLGMLVGSGLFAALRGASLPSLLAYSTLAIGISYLCTAAAPSLAWACVALSLSGLGNGVQWVALVSLVQDLVDGGYQARVMSVLESAASAAPGVGFIAGGVITAALDPRAGFAIAGIGVLLVLAVALLALRRAPLTRASGAASHHDQPQVGSAV